MLNFTPRPFYNLGKSSRHLQNTGWVGQKDGPYVLGRIKTSCLCRESNLEFSMPSPIHLTNCTSRLQICNIYCLHFIYIFYLLISRPYLHFARGQRRTCLILAAALSMTDTLLFNNRRTSPSTRALLLSVIWKVRGRIKHF
jgi:hypothetical protein